MKNDYRNDRRDPRDVDTGTSWGWVWTAFLIIVLVAAFGWWGWGWDRTPGSTTAQRGNPEAVLDQNLDRKVNVSGVVKEVKGSHAFVLGGDSTFQNQDVLVIARRPLNEQPINVSAGMDQNIQIGGTVRKFSREELARELGIELKQDELAEYEGKPVIVAETISAAGSGASRETEAR
jgi:hypothetical protein